MSEEKKTAKSKTASTKKTNTKTETTLTKKTSTKKPKKEIAEVEKVNEEKKETKVVKKTATKKSNKERKALLNDRDQINYRALSKVVKILAKIGKIVLMIFAPFIFLTMIMVPIVFNKFEIEANIIKFDDVNIIVNDDKATVKIGDDVHVFKCDERILDHITTFLTDNPKSSIITFIELSLLLFAIVIVLDIYLLSYLEKLFNNFVNKDTPFIEENTKYIFKIIIFMCALKFINISLNMADLSIINTSSFSIMSILIVFVIYIIFKYAVLLQEKSTDKICD